MNEAAWADIVLHSRAKRLHEYFVHGCRGITYYDRDGQDQTPTIRLVSHQVHENDWLAVNQVTIRSRDVDRRFDLVPYLNGFPGLGHRVQAGRGRRQTWSPRMPSWRRNSASSRLVKYKYPLDKQPEAIKLVIAQMESMAPRMLG